MAIMALLSTSCGTLPRPSRSVSGQLSSTSYSALTTSGSILELPRLRPRAALLETSRAPSTPRLVSGWPYSRHYELGKLVSGLISGSVLPLRLCVKTTASGAQPLRSPGDSTRAPFLGEWPILEHPRLRARAALLETSRAPSTPRLVSGWPYSRHYELGKLVSGLISGSVLPLRLCVKTTASGAQPLRSPGDSTRAPFLGEWPIPSRSTWSTLGCTTDVAASPKQKVPSMPRMALRRRGGGDDEMGDVSVHPNATDGPPLGLQSPGFGESTTLAPPNSAPSLEDVLEGGACAREGDTWHGGSGGSRSLVGPTDCPADCD